jgi:hypothetical protein
MIRTVPKPSVWPSKNFIGLLAAPAAAGAGISQAAAAAITSRIAFMCAGLAEER